MFNENEITVEITLPVRSIGVVVICTSKDVSARVEHGYIQIPEYRGAVEFTPTNERQIIPTMGTAVFDNIVINPIPNNYGLITYNGSFLTVA